ALSGLAQARAMLAWVQILGIVVIFYALQLMLRDATGNLELFAAMPPAWLADLPSGWLATLVARASWDPSRELLGPLLFALLITLSLGVLTLWALARHYAARGGARASSRRALEARPPHRGTLLGRLDRILRRSRLEGAGRWLALRILEREPDTKMRVWIGLGLPAAILALCLLDPAQAGNPLRERGARLVLPLALLPTLAAAVPSALFALSMSSEHRAAWLLARAPGARDALARGAVIAALDTIFLPLLLLGWAIFSFAWGSIADAALHILLAWLVLVTTAHGCGRAVLGRVPFSERPVRAAMSGKVALLAGVSTALAMGVGALYYALAGRPLAILGLGAALGALAWATKRWGWHQGRATERTSLPSESHHG
ncbi:MAG: hypothetical protein OEY14_12580, partial [Myxococcales bacterium]|nr:hypothetical protein [Myxococcales bacterium]